VKCPLLAGVGESIQNPQMSSYLENMEKDECIEDECGLYEECWTQNNTKKDLTEEVFEDG